MHKKLKCAPPLNWKSFENKKKIPTILVDIMKMPIVMDSLITMEAIQ
jgi:hypothetical protein